MFNCVKNQSRLFQPQKWKQQQPQETKWESSFLMQTSDFWDQVREQPQETKWESSPRHSGCPRGDCWAPAIATGDSAARDPPRKLKVGICVAGEGWAGESGRLNNFFTAGCRITEKKVHKLWIIRAVKQNTS
jgi:hypothetical protein